MKIAFSKDELTHMIDTLSGNIFDIEIKKRSMFWEDAKTIIFKNEELRSSVRLHKRLRKKLKEWK